MSNNAVTEKTPVQVDSALNGRDILAISSDWTGDPLSKTHLVRHLAKSNRVLWLNALPNRRPTLSRSDLRRAGNKFARFFEPVKEVEKNIFVLNPLAFPVYHSRIINWLNRKLLLSQIRRALKSLDFRSVVNLSFNPAAGLVAKYLGEDLLIYYCVDEYTAFTDSIKGLGQLEEALFREADLVIVSSQPLMEAKRQFNKNTFLIPHGVDVHHFRRALDPEIELPDDIAHIPHPIIGFHGLLADWIDYELIQRLAERFAAGSIVLIGNITQDAIREIEPLRRFANIFFLGRKPYAQLPAYCKAFDVAINPFKINTLTVAANPLKVREFLAAGKCVVSTNIPAVYGLPYCYTANDSEEFVTRVASILSNTPKAEDVSASVENEDWASRVEDLRFLVTRINAAAVSAPTTKVT